MTIALRDFVANGGFDDDSSWDCGAHWSVADDVASFTGDAVYDSSEDVISQTIPFLQPGCDYTITLTIDVTWDGDPGEIKVYLGGTLADTLTADGTHELSVTTAEGDSFTNTLEIHVYPGPASSEDLLTVDNVSVTGESAGLIARIEEYIKDTLAALTFAGSEVFKTCEVWNHQLGPKAGGLEAIDPLAPFAFAAYNPPDAEREGDYDLRQAIGISVLVGQAAKNRGVARFGDATHLGTMALREFVIDALDGSHPGAGFGCDEIYYDGETEVFDGPQRHVIEMYFVTNKIGV